MWRGYDKSTELEQGLAEAQQRYANATTESDKIAALNRVMYYQGRIA